MKTNNKNIQGLFLILFTFFSLSLSAQTSLGNLTGRISDKETTKSLAGVEIKLKNTKTAAEIIKKSDASGNYKFSGVKMGTYSLTVRTSFYFAAVENVTIEPNKTKTVNFALSKTPKEVPSEPSIPIEEEEKVRGDEVFAPSYNNHKRAEMYSFGMGAGSISNSEGVYHNTESYNAIEENGYKLTTSSPISTFSVDVDAASYSNVRRFLMAGQRPDNGAVRVEEMINYFNYDYPNPTGKDPFSITTEIGDCPWSKNKLVHIGLQGQRIEKDNLPASNLVFLLDVSGSMNSPNKLPLLKSSLKMLVNELSEKDRIAIVVYAGAAGVVLNSTPASNSGEILEALDRLEAGGSTAGGAGIELAYKVAQEHFIKGGNNRVILATDGDFNVGMSSQSAMQELIEKKRESGVFLTCLGFGTGNLKDSQMELLADKGNGNYAYIDNLLEAKKVLVTEIGATLLTIAKDVKIQVEFNPALVESYRLIGYENRLLNTEDFNDDKKDAGEIGAGHSVTALYEVVMKGEGDGTSPSVDPLRYQNSQINSTLTNELLTVKFRYKAPGGDVSQLIERNLMNKSTSKSSDNFRFSAAVAGFGMLLRNSEFKGTLLFDKVIEMAIQAKGEDVNGYRAEFIRLVEAAKSIYS